MSNAELCDCPLFLKEERLWNVNDAVYAKPGGLLYNRRDVVSVTNGKGYDGNTNRLARFSEKLNTWF